MTALPPLPAKFAYTLKEFQQLGGPSKVRCYQLVKEGKLAITYDGNRALIMHAEAQRYFASLPTANPTTARPRGRKALQAPVAAAAAP